MNKEEIKKFLSSIKPLTWVLVAVGALAIILVLVFVLTRQPILGETTAMDSGTQAVEGTVEDAAPADAEETGGEDSSSQETESSDLELAAEEENSEILGEGCDWATCSWMDTEQCLECGGKWQVYGDEAYCECSESKWNFRELEWCKFEGGTWLQDEDRCTFEESSLSAVEGVASACSDLFFFTQSGIDAEYQAYRAACKTAGGTDQCWSEDCNLRVCMCPDEDNVSLSCDWVQGEAVESDIRCYDENGTCWLTIEPRDAIISEYEDSLPDVVVTTSDGHVYSSLDLEHGTSGCIYDENQISCLLTEDGAFNTTEVEDIYMCMDMCCLNLENMEAGSVVVQSGDCPATGNLEVRDFQLVQGVLTFQLRNSMGWDVSMLDIFLDDAKGNAWTTMSCKTDGKYNTIMNCEGWAVYKSGYATISFYYGSGNNSCAINSFKFMLPEMDPCNYDQRYCAYTGTCCGSDYTCCSCGCRKLDDDESCSDACD